MGTRYTVKYIGPELNYTPEQVQKQIDHLFIDINREMSTYIPDSEISQLNNNQSVRLDQIVAETVYSLSSSQVDQ